MLNDSTIYATHWPRKRPPCPHCNEGQVMRGPLTNGGEQAHLYCDTCNWFETHRKGTGNVSELRDIKVCASHGCKSEIKQQRFCDRHYQRWLRSGKPDVEAFIKAGSPVASQWLRRIV